MNGGNLVTREDIQHLALVLLEAQLNIGRVMRENATIKENEAKLGKLLEEHTNKDKPEEKVGPRPAPAPKPKEE